MKITQDQFTQRQADALAERARAEDHRRRQEEMAAGLVAQIVKARQDAEDAATKLYEAATELRTWSRKAIADESSGAYTAFANAHMRLAGAVLQSSKRTAPMDRLLNNAKREQQEARILEEARQKQQDVRAHQKYVQKLTLPSDDAFDDLYGEILTDAQ